MTRRLKVTYEIHADGLDTVGLKERVGHHCSMSEPYAGYHKCDRIRIRSANWHLTTRCNYSCRFCFSRKLDAEIRNLRSAEEVLKKLASLGIEKINFAGGEPLLHPLLFPIIRTANDMAFAVSIISNGYYLNRGTLSRLSPYVDWIGLSVDSKYEEVEVALGRGNGNHVRHTTAIADIVHEIGIKLKINTTVTRVNYTENMRPLLNQLKPKRWKAFQVLHIAGQNDRYFDELSITDKEFDYFKSINQGGVEEMGPVFERNQDMIDSYFMLSPGGMVMSNRDGSYSLTPLDNIDEQKLPHLMDVRKYAERGGIYVW
jgi:radical S-adenosyl methionine domain-containing protein 2